MDKTGPITGCGFDEPLIYTKGVEGEGVAVKGGYDWPNGQKETPNMSELPTIGQQVSIDEAPAEGAKVEVAEGVTSPAVPVMDIDKEKY